MIFNHWHNFCFLLAIMDLEKINRRHLVTNDMYYRVGYGLSSRLLSFKSGTIELEVTIGKKWNRKYNETALEIANCWKNTHSELSSAFACKVYIIDAKKFRYKQHLIHVGIKPGYDAKKGVIFNKNVSN